MSSQCPSVFPTKSGAVFCTHERGHVDDHKGFRKTWRTCASCLRGGNRNCPACRGWGVIVVKKAKVQDEQRS